MNPKPNPFINRNLYWIPNPDPNTIFYKSEPPDNQISVCIPIWKGHSWELFHLQWLLDTPIGFFIPTNGHLPTCSKLPKTCYWIWRCCRLYIVWTRNLHPEFGHRLHPLLDTRINGTTCYGSKRELINSPCTVGWLFIKLLKLKFS